jgi:hypothetical protein
VNPKLRKALLVYALTVLGVFLVAAPWTRLWDEATLFWILAIGIDGLRSDWVRGSVSALGLGDLCVAATEVGALWKLLQVSSPERT